MARTFFTDGKTVKSIPLDSIRNWDDWGITPWLSSPSSVQGVYASVAFLYRCIEVRSSTLAALPWAIYRGETEVASNDIDEMPPDLPYLADLATLLYRTESALCMGSQAFWLKMHNRMRILELRWLDPGTMSPIWSPQGIGAFKREVNGTPSQLPAGDVVYLWLKGNAETTPRPAPAQAALNAAKVLVSMDSFVEAFFDRGAIKGTLLTVAGNPPAAEKEKIKSWWTRTFARGNKTAWEAAVISAEVTPVVIGEGVAELGNSPLTVEKREDIATAMGVPHSLVLSNASNFATSESDRLNFYDQTILPEAKLIQRQMNEQLFAPLGLRFEFIAESLSVYQKDENERATSFAAYVGAGLKPSIAAQILGLDLPVGIEFADLDPEPQPVQLVAAAQDGPMQDEPMVQQREEEAARFKRWAGKRKRPVVTAFKSDILTDAEKEELLGESTVPFEWPTGPLTHEAYKTLLLQLDPDDNEAERTIRLGIERATARNIGAAFNKWLLALFHPPMTPDEVRIAALNIRTPQELRDAIERGLITAADLGVNVAFDQLEGLGMSFDYTLANTAAREWANQYVGELISNIENTTRRAVGEAVGRWVDNGQPLESLIEDLTPVFGRKRAEMIAATETTRAYAEANEVAYRESGVIRDMEWRTANDEKVCPICGMLNGKRAPLGSTFDGYKPPAHPNCRCWIVGVVP